MVKSKDWTGKEWKTNQCPKKLENYCPGPLFFFFLNYKNVWLLGRKIWDVAHCHPNTVMLAAKDEEK